MASISTYASLSEQQPFTFTSPASSETHEDALDFDYESWVQQSKIANYHSNLWPDDGADAQAIIRHNLPEEAYELSLRDLSELSSLPSRATATDGSALNSSVRWSNTARSPSSTKPWRRKTTTSMEGAGFIIRLFMPSPSRASAGGRRKKSFSATSATVPALREKENSDSANESSMENDPTCTRSHSMPRKNHQNATNRYLQALRVTIMPGLPEEQQQQFAF